MELVFFVFWFSVFEVRWSRVLFTVSLWCYQHVYRVGRRNITVLRHADGMTLNLTVTQISGVGLFFNWVMNLNLNFKCHCSRNIQWNWSTAPLGATTQGQDTTYLSHLSDISSHADITNDYFVFEARRAKKPQLNSDKNSEYGLGARCTNTNWTVWTDFQAGWEKLKLKD